jgi:HECT-domain (ubiquitin-transferase)
MKEFEPQLYTTMKNILTCPKVEDMALTFSTSYDNFGFEQIVEFLECGQTIAVTDANKHQFVALYVDWFLNTSIESQFRPFYKGFYKVMSSESIRVGLVVTAAP